MIQVHKKVDNAEIEDKQSLGKLVALITISPKTFAAPLVVVACGLFLINLTALYIREFLGISNFFTNAVAYFFDVSLEHNIPALFSTIILFVAASLLFFLYKLETIRHSKNTRYWLLLSLIFLFLAIDEATTVHERFNQLLVVEADGSGYLKYSWVLPYAALSIIAGLYFLRFVLSLPSRSRNLFMISGTVYVLAALAFEPFEGRLTVLYGPDNVYDKLLCVVEEFLEMSAIILFIYALIDYLSRQFPMIRINSIPREGPV